MIDNRKNGMIEKIITGLIGEQAYLDTLDNKESKYRSLEISVEIEKLKYLTRYDRRKQ